MGRPKAKIDEDQVREMAYNGASNKTIADILGVDDQTIANRFSKLLRKTRGERRLAIAKAQTDTCLGGNPTLQIWLGKNDLGQSDEQTVKVDLPPNAIVFEVVKSRNADASTDSADAG